MSSLYTPLGGDVGGRAQTGVVLLRESARTAMLMMLPDFVRGSGLALIGSSVMPAA